MTTGTQAKPVNWPHELVEQLEWHWKTSVRPKLEGLTDEEYFWEPVANCWSVRRREESTAKHAAGAGDLVAEIEFPEPDPVPLTTIAWRLAHVTVGVLGMRASNHFGDGSLTYQTATWPATAADALAELDRQYDAWLTGVRGLDDQALRRRCGPAEGPYAELPFATLVLHISREVIHHSAEVLLLRDLYRTSDGGRAWNH